MNKQRFKHIHKCCAICGIDRYELLDVHRIVEGAEYSEGNCINLCGNCHKSHHRNLIRILDKRKSTDGYVLFWIDKNGIEQITKI